MSSQISASDGNQKIEQMKRYIQVAPRVTLASWSVPQQAVYNTKMEKLTLDLNHDGVVTWDEYAEV